MERGYCARWGRMTTIFFHIIHLVTRRLGPSLIWRADSKQRLLGLRRCSMKAAASFLSQIAATKAFLEQKFKLPVECVAQGLGNQGGVMTTIQAMCLGAMLAWTPSLVVLALLLREAPLDELERDPS